MAGKAANLSLCMPKTVTNQEAPITPKQAVTIPFLKYNSWKGVTPYRSGTVKLTTMATPQSLSEQIAESVKKAEETCAGDATSGECRAAWDEVEEVSAAASHLRDRNKNSDPLEDFCKGNPETDECRTYED